MVYTIARSSRKGVLQEDDIQVVYNGLNLLKIQVDNIIPFLEDKLLSRQSLEFLKRNAGSIGRKGNSVLAGGHVPRSWVRSDDAIKKQIEKKGE